MNKTLHILGMAKSSLDLRGAKASKLELDFFKLAYAVRHLKECGFDAVGYLLVLNAAIRKTAEDWISKYDTGDAVRVLVQTPNAEELKNLRAEKLANARALLQDAKLAEAERELSVAKYGKIFGEGALRTQISQLHPKSSEIKSPSSMPLKIAWDYFGTVN